MHPLEKEIMILIREEDLLQPGEVVVVGVSAGPDSMALVHLLVALSPVLMNTVVAVYVNHQLRPEEAGRESLLVEQQAQKLGISFLTGCIDVKGEAEKRKISTEHAARELRYEFLSQAAQKFFADKIAVAHTADDQSEEVLLRLIRGTGRSGLSGMKMIREGRIVRPLLNTSKEKLLGYLADKGIPFLVDSSNLERNYLRNRIRLDLIPYLRQFNPNVSETLRQTAAVLQDEEAFLERLARKLWDQIVMVLPDNTEYGLPVISVELHSFLALDRSMQRRIAEKVFIALQSQAQFKKIEQILHVAANADVGARLHFSKGLRMKKNRDHLVFSYPEGKIGKRGDFDETLV